MTTVANHSTMAVPAASSWRRVLRNHETALEVALLALLATIGIIARVIRAGMLDSFEDGYQRWWISANLLQTGQHVDMYSMMTLGNWLPFYDYVGAGLLAIFGLHNIWAMKGFNIMLSVGLMGIAYLMGRRFSRTTGILAFAFMALSPADIILGTTASPDTLGVFSVLVAVYAYTYKPIGQRWSLVISALFFLISVATVYEAWLVLIVFLLYYIVKDRRNVRWKDLFLISAPAIAFCAAWFLYVSQWGFLPSIIISQTSVDVNYQLQAGTQPSALSQLTSFWSAYSAHFFVVFLLSVVYLGFRGWRRVEGVIYAVFLPALVVYSALHVGQPSPRYVYVTIPISAVFAARALTGGARRLRDTQTWRRLFGQDAWNMRKFATVALSLLFVFTTVTLDTGRVVAPLNAPGVYLQPTQRAGEFLATINVPAGKLVVFESPIAAYYSGLPPTQMIGSRLLPHDRQAAENFLRGSVAYVVYVDVPYYPMQEMFPELAAGNTTGIFTLVYNANSWEADFGAHLVYVYAVNSNR